MAELPTLIGKVTHFYSELGVAIIKLNTDLKVGDTINIKGHTTDFTEEVTEIQFDHKSIDAGQEGQEVGVKVSEKVRDGDNVYLS